MKNRICITGAAGYIGSRLVQEWSNKKYKLVCLDRFSNGINRFKEISNDSVDIIKTDIRNLDEDIFKNIDIVIDLSAKSKNTENENVTETISINQYGRQFLANAAKKQNVRKYIRISGTSVYGFQNELVDEKSLPNPKTSYAAANLAAEKELMKMNDDMFSVTILRFPSVFGFSPNMRWDEAINQMVLRAHNEGKIIVRGESHKRPFLHINDAIRSIESVINADDKITKGQIFNVGDNKLNYKIGDLASEVASCFKKEIHVELNDSPDMQSHTIMFNKINSELGFFTKYDVVYGVNEIYKELINQKD